MSQSTHRTSGNRTSLNILCKNSNQYIIIMNNVLHDTPYLWQGRSLAAQPLSSARVLRMRAVTSQHAGLYTYLAGNSEGDGESNALVLDVTCE